jgi:hypothetical protein
MQVQTPILAHEEIAKGRTAILRAVVVVPRATAGHERYVTGGKHIRQSKRARPIRHRLHATLVVRPACSRSCQGHYLYVTGLQDHARRYLPFPICKQTGRGYGYVDRACQHNVTHASTADSVVTPEIGSEAVLHSMLLKRGIHRMVRYCSRLGGCGLFAGLLSILTTRSIPVTPISADNSACNTSAISLG